MNIVLILIIVFLLIFMIEATSTIKRCPKCGCADVYYTGGNWVCMDCGKEI